jgi:hypothetical protein
LFRRELVDRSFKLEEAATRQNLYSLNFNKKIGWAVGGEGIVLRCDCD